MHYPNNPQNRQVYQEVRHATQASNYQKCQSAQECHEKVVEGHLIPENHLNRLQPKSGKVVVPGKYAAVLGPIRKEFPHVPVSKATVGHFSCIKHDQSLAPFDMFASLAESTDGQLITQILDNLYLRGLMHQRWWMQSRAQSEHAKGQILTQDRPHMQRSAERLAETVSSNHEREGAKLLEIQKQIERFTLINEGPSRCNKYSSMLLHTTFKAAAKPHIAAYQLGITLQSPGQPVRNLLPIQTALIALEDGYIFVISSTPGYHSFAPRCILGNDRSAPTGKHITKAILRNCETLAFSEPYWNCLPGETQQQIVAANTDPTPGTPITVDLLEGTHWELLPTR